MSRSRRLRRGQFLRRIVGQQRQVEGGCILQHRRHRGVALFGQVISTRRASAGSLRRATMPCCTSRSISFEMVGCLARLASQSSPMVQSLAAGQGCEHAPRQHAEVVLAQLAMKAAGDLVAGAGQQERQVLLVERLVAGLEASGSGGLASDPACAIAGPRCRRSAAVAPALPATAAASAGGRSGATPRRRLQRVGDREFAVAEDERRAVGGGAALDFADEEPVVAMQRLGAALAFEPGERAIDRAGCRRAPSCTATPWKRSGRREAKRRAMSTCSTDSTLTEKKRWPLKTSRLDALAPGSTGSAADRATAN